MQKILGFLPEGMKHTTFVRLFGFTKVPLIWFIRPKVITLDEKTTKISIPFVRKNKNHLGSMYFGVLCAAADVAGGLAAMKHITDSGEKIALSFASFQADFHKRAIGETFLINEQGEEIKKFVEEVIESGERQNMDVKVYAYTDQMGDEPVASFTLKLSLKKRG